MATMGVEVASPQIPTQEIDPSLAELSADQILDQTIAPINEQLNLAVSHELQGKDARQKVDALSGARESAKISKELETGSNQPLSSGAQEARGRGETAESLLAKSRESFSLFESLTKQEKTDLDFEGRLHDAREMYTTKLTQRRSVLGRGKQKEELIAAETEYNQALVNKIAQVMNMDPNLRKAPYIPELVSNLKAEHPDLKELSENHFHVLVDQLARERLLKAQAIERHSNMGMKRIFHVLQKNRAVRIAVGATIWSGSVIATNKGLLPHNSEYIGNDLDKVLPIVAGYFTGKDVLGAVGDAVDNFKKSRRLQKNVNALAADALLSDQALRTVYSGIEYQDGQIKSRSAGQTADTNKQVFANINSEFAKLQAEGARGGKPYRSSEVLDYVADLYINRKDKIDEILSSDDPKAAFIGLCSEMIAADSNKFTQERKANYAKRAAYSAFALAGSVIASQWMLQAGRMRDSIDQPSLKMLAD